MKNIISRAHSQRHVSRLTIFASLLLGTACLLLPASDIAQAGDTKAPEYMRLEYLPGLALEIKGSWDSAGVFVASDIETLPKPRSPKLRGSIQAIDRKNSTITVFGVEIDISSKTQFLERDSSQGAFAELSVGQRVEVSCKVSEEGKWKARKIRAKNVKSNSKIKGALTRVQVDGSPPDTIEIYGLLILLTKETDFDEPRSELELLEEELFQYGALPSASQARAGRVLSDRLLLTGKYRGWIRSENEYDLSPTRDNDLSDTQPGAKAGVTAYLSSQTSAFAQIRLRKSYTLSNDRTPAPTQDFEFDITQLYLLWRNINGSGVTVQVGRQDFDEPREWLFDEYIEALRVFYYGSSPLILEAAWIDFVSPLNSKFDTWKDIFLQARWRPSARNSASLYLLRRQDSSIRNRQPVWWGARYYGHPLPGVRAWFDGAVMRGEDKGKSLNAWAVDLGATTQLAEGSLKPTVTIGYAIGSGDDGASAESNEFRQTGYEDNVALLSGRSSVRYYGEALNPELANIVILTLSVAVQPVHRGSIEVIYHKYRQHRKDSKLRDSDLLNPPAIPSGFSDDLGWEIDVVFASPKLWDRARMSWTVGWFKPGAAFDPQLETATLSRFNVDFAI